MSEFTPITTQEEFDKAIKGRLAQKDRELEEKFKPFGVAIVYFPYTEGTSSTMLKKALDALTSK